MSLVRSTCGFTARVWRLRGVGNKWGHRQPCACWGCPVVRTGEWMSLASSALDGHFTLLTICHNWAFCTAILWSLCMCACVCGVYTSGDEKIPQVLVLASLIIWDSVSVCCWASSAKWLRFSCLCLSSHRRDANGSDFQASHLEMDSINSGDSNSGPRACAANPLPNEPSSQPCAKSCIHSTLFQGMCVYDDMALGCCWLPMATIHWMIYKHMPDICTNWIYISTSLSPK